jgi:hypothetical protein
VVVGKEECPEDLFKKMNKGKSLHVSSAESQVTLHEIVDRNNMAIRVLLTPIQDNSTVTNQ